MGMKRSRGLVGSAAYAAGAGVAAMARLAKRLKSNAKRRRPKVTLRSTRRKRRVRSKTRVRRGRKRNFASTGLPWSVSGGTFGKRLRTQRYINKLVKANKQTSVVTFKNVTSMDSPGGAIPLNHFADTGVNNAWVPIDLYDITSFANLVDGTNINYAKPGWRVCFSGATGQPFFVNIYGRDADGSTASQLWRWEKGPGASNGVANLPHQKDLLKWVSCKLMLYGTNTQAVRYRVQLVQFKNNWLVPELQAPADVDQKADFINFWQNQMKRLLYNPIMNMTTRSSGMRVLKSWTVLIQPKETIDQTVAPNFHQLNLFFRLNRLQNYDWANDLYNTAAGIDDDTFVPETGYNQEYVHPKARMFIMITATAPTGKQGAAALTPGYTQGFGSYGTAADTPSYDINLRCCHEQVE